MPQFTRYSINDEIPPVPEGWLFVMCTASKMKIVDSRGNSLLPAGRALVDANDPRVKELIASGDLLVESQATVSLDNYVELKINSGAEDTAIMLLKKAMMDNTDKHQHAHAGEPAEQATDEQIAAKEEAVRKSRKKKVAEPEPQPEISDSSEEVVEQNADSSEQIIPQETDTSASEQEPSV